MSKTARQIIEEWSRQALHDYKRSWNIKPEHRPDKLAQLAEMLKQEGKTYEDIKPSMLAIVQCCVPDDKKAAGYGPKFAYRIAQDIHNMLIEQFGVELSLEDLHYSICMKTGVKTKKQKPKRQFVKNLSHDTPLIEENTNTDQADKDDKMLEQGVHLDSEKVAKITEEQERSLLGNDPEALAFIESVRELFSSKGGK